MAEIDSINAIRDHIRQEELKHVYLFYGPEVYLKDLYTSRIRARVGCDDMNCFYFSSDADVREIASICSSVSMFGDRQLIVVSGSGFFRSSTVTDFADAANDSNTYIVFKEDDVDKRNKLYKKVCDTGIVFNCKRQGTAEIKKLISSRVVGSGRRISDNVLQYMTDGIGNDISTLLAETEKLILYVPEGAYIERSHVDALCNMRTNAGLFDINDAIAAKDHERAFLILRKLLDDREPPVKILAIVSKMWSRLYNVKVLMNDGARSAEIASLLGIKEFAASKLMRQASGIDTDLIRRHVMLCGELDSSVKSGEIKDLTAAEIAAVM